MCREGRASMFQGGEGQHVSGGEGCVVLVAGMGSSLVVVELRV